MCGRYTLSTPADLVAEVFELADPPELAPRYNIAPTQEAAIVHPAGGDRVLRLARWGLGPGNRTINARSESVGEKPLFRDAFRSRRCLVPADGFYEWQARGGGAKQPFHLTLADGAPFAFAGLYERESFAILTTRPNSLVAPIHDRMPVILRPEAHAVWLDPAIRGADALRPLFEPYPAGEMRATPVSQRVNSPANEGPGCIQPVTLAAEPRNLTLWD